MNDPHVVSLRYRLVTDATVSYSSPPAITHETSTFKTILQNDVLTVNEGTSCDRRECDRRSQ